MTETVKNRIMIFGPEAAGGKAARADGRSWVACTEVIADRNSN
jgi:hypothetical protein